ncbi:beta-N-acetylhexosaminidase [Vibrio hannami]|uniref:beta-N-acetylhexosaminidase n=1 Tax=Vibrio hannami TaxID=2717094 RepID=UPI00240F2462|nr:beta-N-acetylhexosaminidase [Vibrio hannami]MDG3087170.1 beta-N-acetylhexosaminidase [Vibrio hannami]
MEMRDRGFYVEQAVVSEKEKTSQLQITLFNNTEQTIRDWKLNFSFTLVIHPDSVTNGSLEQVGTYCLFSPEQDKSLEPGERFEFHFNMSALVMRNQTWGVQEANVVVNNKYYSAQLSSLSVLNRYEQDSGRYENVELSPYSIIPRPNKLSTDGCKVALSKELTFSLDTELALPALKWLRDELTKHTDISLRDTTSGKLSFSFNKQLSDDAYKLEVRERHILLQAGGKLGFIHGCSTILQLVLADPSSMFLPCITVEDQPRYKYRGMMLDCARHFHSIDAVKGILNQLAYYKYNVFHWHLTDDEGWRIEIDAYPELTEIGAWRGPELTLEGQYTHLSEIYGGYYTKTEIKEIILYAEERGITVIPEIDIPGHCRAAIKSLPELLVDSKDNSSYQSVQGYKDNILDPSLNGTYKFIDTVLEEVCDLFPSPYVHIGGDEVPEGVWQGSEHCTQLMNRSGYCEPGELQGHILRHAENKLKSLGKRMLGWEEAHHGEKVSTDTVIYSWLSEEAAIKCARKGFDVVLQPAQYLYFDMAQSNNPDEQGVDWSNPISLEKTYCYEPLSELEPSHEIHSRVLGIQCAIWSEFIPNNQRLEYMLYPRLLASAEAAWTNSENRDWKEFLSRLKGQLTHMDKLKIHYRNPWEV